MSVEEMVDQALEKAGNKHKYQKLLIIFLCLIWVQNAFLVLGPSFFYMDPIFECQSEENNVAEDVACKKIQQCKLVNDYTIVAYAQLYCDGQTQRSVIQSALPIGSFMGLILMNFLSDRKGRKLAIRMDLCIGLCGVIFIIIGAYTKIVALLVIASIMSGFCGYSLVTISYIVIGDFCEDNLRQRGVAIVNLFWSVGMTLFFPLYMWCREWYNILVLFMLIPMIGLVVVSFFLLEQSPKLLLCKKKDKKKCLQSLLSVAAYNEVPKNNVREIQLIIQNASLQNNKQQSQPSMLEVYKQWKYLKIILLTGITQTGGNLIFYGIQFAINDIGFNYGIDNLLLGTAEIATAFALTFFMMKVRRKRTIYVCYIISGVLGVCFIFPFVNDSEVISSIIIVILRICTTIGYTMIAMIQTQSFPVQIQSVGAGSIQGLGQLGCFLSPLLVTIAVNTQTNKMFILSLGLLLLIFPLKFVPETLKRQYKKENEQSLLQEQNKQSVLST